MALARASGRRCRHKATPSSQLCLQIAIIELFLYGCCRFFFLSLSGMLGALPRAPYHSTDNYYPPPPQKHYENNLPRIFLCNFWELLRQNCVIIKKLIPQEIFCVSGDRRDLRLFHVELREIFVTPKKRFLREFFCVIDYVKSSQPPRK